VSAGPNEPSVRICAVAVPVKTQRIAIAASRARGTYGTCSPG
jgi:hypothetical protein